MREIRYLSLTLAAVLVFATVATAQTTAEQEELAADAAGQSVEAPEGAPVEPLQCGPGTVQSQFHFSDFESNAGGWNGTGLAPWELGTPILGVYEDCDTSPRDEPPGAFSGSNVWATNLNGCYANSDSESLLSQTFNFSGLSAPIRLSWWHWYEIFIEFDMGQLIVNGGAPLWEVETTAAVGYVREAVDLSPFAGNPSVAIDFRLFATSVVNRTGWYVDDVLIEHCEEVPDARFLVTKDFNDNNTAEVEVTLSCNTGLPLEQTIGISEGDPINFVVGDFEQGTLDCEITEVVPDGYTASYAGGTGDPAVSCEYEDLFGGQYNCAITNSLQQVTVDVTKEWIDENPQFGAINTAEAEWECSNVASGSDDGFLNFFGNPDTESFAVFPDWDTGTTCSITETTVFDGGVEIDDSDCQGILLFPGEEASCTIVNTRHFEGIPTLSQYGMVVLALLMLGAGLIGFRRLV